MVKFSKPLVYGQNSFSIERLSALRERQQIMAALETVRM